MDVASTEIQKPPSSTEIQKTPPDEIIDVEQIKDNFEDNNNKHENKDNSEESHSNSDQKGRHTETKIATQITQFKGFNASHLVQTTLLPKDGKDDSFGADGMNTSLSLEMPQLLESEKNHKLTVDKTNRARWTTDEDKKLLDAVQKYRDANKNIKALDFVEIRKLSGLDRGKDRLKARHKKISQGSKNASPNRLIRSLDDPSMPDIKKVKTESRVESDLDDSVMETGHNSIKSYVSMQHQGTQMDEHEKIDVENLLREHVYYKKKSEELESVMKDTQTRVTRELLEILRSKAKLERASRKQEIRTESIRLGQMVMYRRGVEFLEEWQDGEALQKIEIELKENEGERAKYDALKKNIGKTKSSVKKQDDEIQLRIAAEQEEVYKIKIAVLKKEEQELHREKEKYLQEKSALIRRLKLERDEERSPFNNFPVIADRYLLMHLLGKGGFSEVYQAYDLHDYQMVACKIHQLAPNWPDKRKASYVKHVLRECEIQQSIKHPRIVGMYNSFSHSNDTFVTIMEYCKGNDLDLYLKSNGSIPEKEAKLVMSQVFAGLAFLNQQPRKIIHYDLKPANILFGEDGSVKLTDFGLSKMIDDETENSIELTSQGAGTYWYLPPECFDREKIPKISSKVDVWSAGVVFYQLLYGQKPFGNDQTQQKILTSGLISQNSVVSFPTKPTVSEETKRFIQRCLTPNVEYRPEVVACYKDPYWTPHQIKSMGPPKNQPQ